eukprot:TRINITY_DN55147_c0_g1_i1.p1 TRINITY_DN55147_c0_g1~~TRINITY_DN55147_c0_g1_i1.p1  ORF type:complete len:265 (+),score=62.40 TRINITY_DN55147_c0_g1_i1:80-874(+)
MAAFRFAEFDEGVKASGCRCTWIEGLPATYAVCIRLVLEVKKVNVLFIRHPLGPEMGGPPDGQDELMRLTAQRSLPVVFWNDERPRTVWNEMVHLAERIGSGPQLIPSDPEQRMQVFGLMELLVGENGLVWCKRHMFGDSPLIRKYGYTPEAEKAAPGKLCAILAVFDKRLAAQQAKGSKFLVGDSLSAADLYFTGSTIAVDPPGTDIIPRTQQGAALVERFGSLNTREIKDAFTPRLRAFRDFIFKTYVQCPMDLGGIPVSSM